MSAVVLIPARWASSRFPGKPLAPLRGANGTALPLILRSLAAARQVAGVAAVHVVTDDARIADVVRDAGGSALMTSPAAHNGSERCAEAVAQIDGGAEIIVNFQGDALLTPPTMVEALLAHLAATPGASVATPVMRQRWQEVRALAAEEAAGRVGGTSAVGAPDGRALYFSKRLIPYLSPATLAAGAADDLSPVRLHIGVYAYRRAALAAYAETPPGALEELEGLEQLRLLDAGVRVDLVEVPTPAFTLRELNNPEDVAPIEAALTAAGIA